jgi:hypothetical protein
MRHDERKLPGKPVDDIESERSQDDDKRKEGNLLDVLRYNTVAKRIL